MRRVSPAPDSTEVPVRMTHDTERGHSKPAATALTSVRNSRLLADRCFETTRVTFSVSWDEQQNQSLAATAEARSRYQLDRAPTVRGLQTPTPREESPSDSCNHEYRHQRFE